MRYALLIRKGANGPEQVEVIDGQAIVSPIIANPNEADKPFAQATKIESDAGRKGHFSEE